MTPKRRRIARLRIPVWTMLLLLLAGCGGRKFLWTEHYNFPSNTWMPQNAVKFVPDTVDLTDSTAVAGRGVVSLRYASDASVEEFPLVMEVESPEKGIYRSDTIRIKFLTEENRTASKGRMGLFETCDTINLTATPTPGWNVTFYPATEEDLTGIFSLTFQLIE